MTNTENIFTFIDRKAGAGGSLYLEGITEACGEWLLGKDAPDVSGDVTREEIRRGIQLAVLKGMKQFAQPHHQMTPDSIGMLVGYFAEKLLKPKNQETSSVPMILDPAAGTGNLLFTVMNALESNTDASAVEIDELLVRLAAASSELMEQPVRFYVQDALRPLLIDPVDLVVSDLPIGYYPDDDNGLNFEMMPAEGHAYSHHLFIEQSLNHLKEGGFGIFVTTAGLFDSEQSEILKKYIKRHAVIRAIIQLPDTLFKNAAQAKILLIVQKPAKEMAGKQSSDVLLAKVPDMTDKNSMIQFFGKVDRWAAEI